MFSGRINNCFDSHVHWLATGEVSERLDLHGLKSPLDLARLTIAPHHRRADWLLGFGWDQNRWPSGEFPTREHLDQVFGPQPVAFSRADGHALWVSTAGLKKAGLFSSSVADSHSGRVIRDQNHLPTGILIDGARSLVDQLIPPPSSRDISRSLLRGLRLFNQAGFTHIRDLSCTSSQWEQAVHLEESGLLTLAVEQFFSVEDDQDFPTALKLASSARRWTARKEGLLRPKGIKVFLDGALGSEGAWLSCTYGSGSGNGLQLLSLEDLESVMTMTFSMKFELAVHVIGDEAAHQTVLVYKRILSKGIQGHLHLEHAEILRPETAALMRGCAITCHLQPCHWLSDQSWLSEKIGDLKHQAFPWRLLQENQIDFDFGSDSPIEVANVMQNLAALQMSVSQGVPALLGDWSEHHSHRDSSWVPNCYTVFTAGEVSEVLFRGEHLR